MNFILSFAILRPRPKRERRCASYRYLPWSVRFRNAISICVQRARVCGHMRDGGILFVASGLLLLYLLWMIVGGASDCIDKIIVGYFYLEPFGGFTQTIFLRVQ